MAKVTSNIVTRVYGPRRTASRPVASRASSNWLGILPAGQGDDALPIPDAQVMTDPPQAVYGPTPDAAVDDGSGPPAAFDPSMNPQVPGLTLDPRTGMYTPVLRQSAHPGWEAAAQGALRGLQGASFTSPYASNGTNILGGLLSGVLGGAASRLAGQATNRQAENDAATKQANDLNMDTVKNMHAQALAKARWDAHRAAMTGETSGGSSGSSGLTIKSGRGNMDGWSASDAELGERIRNGEWAPDALGSRGVTTTNRGVFNYLAHNHYDWKKAMQQYAAEKKSIASLNSPQQQRMGQAIDSVLGTMQHIDESIDALSSTMPRTNSQWANQGLDVLASQGVLGDDAKNALQAFNTTTSMSVDELAQAMMGGGVPSEKAMALAQAALDKHGSVNSIRRATSEIRFLLGVRKAAINNTQPKYLQGTQPNAPAPMLGIQSAHPLDAFVRGH